VSYFDALFFAHPDTINHPVTFIDGTIKWLPMTANEKRLYQLRVDYLLSEYATFLLDNANATE